MDDGLPISMRSLGHEAYDRLRRSLMTGQIAPGARIIETEMARQFGTSQAPIREALARLREDGLVRRLPYKGTYATEIIPRELYHTCRVRAEIESNGLELTVGRLTQTQIAELQALVSRMDALAADTPQEYFQQVQMDMAFHRRLVEWTDIAVYQRIWHSLELAIERFLNLVHPSLFAHDRSLVVQQHRDLLKIVQQGDVLRAQAAFRQHIMLIWNKLDDSVVAADRFDLSRVPTLESGMGPQDDDGF